MIREKEVVRKAGLLRPSKVSRTVEGEVKGTGLGGREVCCIVDSPSSHKYVKVSTADWMPQGGGVEEGGELTKESEF